MRFWYIKFFLIVPIFIWIYFQIKLFFNFKNYKKNKLKLIEEKRYFWVKKYSKFLCWLFSISNKKNFVFWKDKKIITIIKTDSIYKPLIFISKNNFEYQLPILIAINKSDFQKIPNFLKKLYFLIDCYFIEDDLFSELEMNDMIKKIKIPRVLFYFTKKISCKTVEKFVEISKETFSKLISSTYFGNNFIIKNEKRAEDLILLDSKIFSKKVSKFINE